MSRRRGARAARILVSLVLLITAMGPGPTAAATDRLPNLQMDPLDQFYTEHSGGQWRLRFRTVMTNHGAGPLEVLGSRSNRGETHFTTQQRIYNTAGGNRVVPSRALMEYARDGHNHWHIQGVMLYQLWSDDGRARRGTKVGFCFLDSVRRPPGGGSVYRNADCGTQSSLHNRMGLSVGWGDDYPANFTFQWIDISTLDPGDYVVQARADEQNWYLESNESDNCAWARVRIHARGQVDVLARGQGGCLAPPPNTSRAERQYGDDRYQTAAQVSEDGLPAGVPVAYVATGANFPDALAAGAAAGAQGGPVILVQHNFVPALAVAELERLNPGRIVVVGGTRAISDYVVSIVDRYQTGGGTTRVAGADRYQTAVAISQVFANPATVYIASGENWPDALAAVPYAVRASGPVLPVLRDVIPDVVKGELDRLNPGRIIVSGGPAAVSDAVLAELEAYHTGGGVIRIHGEDRYVTAAELALFHHPTGAEFVYVATGANFPDALAAGPVAGMRGAPMVLVRTGSIPGSSNYVLDTMNPRRVFLLGGPGVISTAVEDALANHAHGG